MPTIMIRHATEEQLDLARQLTHQTTASRALVDCVERLDRCQVRCEQLSARVDQLERELLAAQQVIRSAHDSAAALVAASREYQGVLL